MKTIKYITLSVLALITLGKESKAQNQYLVSQYMLHHGFVNPAAIANSDVAMSAAFPREAFS